MQKERTTFIHKEHTMKNIIIFLIPLSFFAKVSLAENSISLEKVPSSDFVDLRHNSWVLREAFFGKEYNTDIVDYGSLLSDDCAFATDDNEFDINQKSPYYKEIRHNRRRVYRIRIEISEDDITYDFHKKGFVFDSDFSIWSNQFYPDEAGKFFFRKGSYIPMSEEKAHTFREEIDDSYSGISIVVDIRIYKVSEWTEKKQHSNLGKGFMLMFGADYQDINKSWRVRHRKVLVAPVRFQVPLNTKETYAVTILSHAEKRALRNAGGSYTQYNTWANYPGSQLTVDAYKALLRLGLSADSSYRKMIEAGIAQNEFVEIKKIGGSLSDLIRLKHLGLSINDYRKIQSHNGSLKEYDDAKAAGCNSLDIYLWSLTHNMASSDLHFLCGNDIAPSDIDTLFAHGHDVATFRRYYSIRRLSVSDFLRHIAPNNISTETYEMWAPHITNTEEIAEMSGYEHEDFQQYHAIAPLSATEYKQLKDDTISRSTYRTWTRHVQRIEQYTPISKYNATLQEYKYFKTFGKDVDHYLTRLAHGWRESNDYLQYKWDIGHKYLYPHRRKSLYLMLGCGVCAGLGFTMYTLAEGLPLDSAQDLYDDYQQNPSDSTWDAYKDAYKNRYNTGRAYRRTGNISFYTAGGLAILSGVAFFLRKENPHYISTAATGVHMHIGFSPNAVQLTFSKSF